jgi:hypothetical protein
MNKPIGVGVKPSQTHNHVCFQQSNITLARRLLPVRKGSTKSYHPVHAGTIFRASPHASPSLAMPGGSAGVFANVSARPFVRGTCSTHKALAWANHALATAVRWRSAGKCKICLSWKTPITSSESPKTTADAMSDSATHWQAAAKAVNSATLLDIAPDNHICQRRRALMGLWRTRRRSLMLRYRWIRCYARLR